MKPQFVDRLLEPVEGSADFSEAHVNKDEADGLHIRLLSEILQFFEKFLRFADPACSCVGTREKSQRNWAASRKLCDRFSSSNCLV